MTAIRPACLSLTSLLVCLLLSSPLPALTLVKDGQAQAVIVVSKEAFDRPPAGAKNKRVSPSPVQAEKDAALDLQGYIEKISGCKLQIAPAGEAPEGLVPILVGSAADAALDAVIHKKSKDPAAFVLDVTDKAVNLRGLSAEGTYFAACALLEQLGVRWYMPGEIGEVVPRSAAVALAPQRTVQGPTFAARHLQGVTDEIWCRRVRLGGPHFPSSHGIRLPKGYTLETHPELFSLNSGKRTKRQLCLSNPEVLHLTIQTTKEFFRQNPGADIMGIGANDGGGFCECDKCRALDAGDMDKFANDVSVTDRYVRFFNQVLDGIADEFPDKRLGFYAYSRYHRPPVKVKPSPRLVPAVALITICRIHSMTEAVCPEKGYERQIIQQWGKLVPEVYYRGYWFNLADPGLPFFMVHRIAGDIREGRKLGVAGWRVETLAEWAGGTPSLYVGAKLMWNADADVPALMADFYEKFLGPAAAPMKRYIELMENARANGDYHTGSSWDFPLMYNAKVRAAARQALGEAAKLADKPPYQKRVGMYTRCLDYLDAFVKMIESRQRHEYAASKEGLEAMNAIRQELWAHDPPLLGKTAQSYLERFFATTTEQGAARVTGGNKMLVGLKDVWEFQTDPKRVGEERGWYKPQAAGPWKPLSTSASWSTQGLRYYKGLAWYRQTVNVPREAAGKRVFLWIGGFDELAKVWINGREVGVTPKMSFKPCEMDATQAIAPGAANTVVICVRNDGLDELGTGGLIGPVMLYLPAAGEKAQVENLKPPAKSFPEY